MNNTVATLSQIYPHWNWNFKSNAKLRLEFQVEYRFKLEFQVELLICWESVEEVRQIGFHMTTSDSVNRPWIKNLNVLVTMIALNRAQLVRITPCCLQEF